VLLSAGWVAWLSWSWLQSDPHFRLAAVELEGEQYVTRSEVEAVFQADFGKNIWELPLEKRRRELEEIPWVSAATITRILPDRLRIGVEERVPVAFVWTRGEVALIDAQGLVLEVPPGFSQSFPVIRGISETEPVSQRKAKMRLFATLVEELGRGEARFLDEISEVDVSDGENVSVVVADGLGGALQLHLGKEEFLNRFNLYASQIGQWRQEFPQIQSIDLRYEGQVVIQAGTPQDGGIQKRSIPALSGSSPSTIGVPREGETAAEGAPAL
jgi:cell division protein FtsQ